MSRALVLLVHLRSPASTDRNAIVTGDAGAPRAVPPTEPAVAEASPRLLVRTQLGLALDVYGVLAAATDQDLVLGTTSPHTALLMVRAGARGRTAEEMDAVLHLREHAADPLATSVALDQVLRSRANDEGVELATGNRGWIHEQLSVLATYERDLGLFDAGLARLDIASDPEHARQTVNRWAAEVTRGKIDELMPRGSINIDTRLVLATAVYLHARWKHPFPAERTEPAPFRLLDGIRARPRRRPAGRDRQRARRGPTAPDAAQLPPPRLDVDRPFLFSCGTT